MTISTDDYFKLFSIKDISEISKKELQKRYRKLALKFHPDKINDNGERFRILHSAYEYLCERMQEFLKEDDKKFFNPDYLFYSNGSIYDIEKKRWVRVKDDFGNWVKIKRKAKK